MKFVACMLKACMFLSREKTKELIYIRCFIILCSQILSPVKVISFVSSV